MAIKSVLVHIDGAERCRFRLATAMRIAQDFDAQLVGIYLVPDTELSPSVAALLPNDIVDARVRAIGEEQHHAEAAFRKAVAAEGLARVEWRAPAGNPLEAAVAHGRCADLFVLGQREGPGAAFDEELVSEVMLASGRPLLVVPYIGARPSYCDNVLIAWDGGREAARAVADALPLLKRAQQIHVIAVKGNGHEHAGEHPGGDRLAAWLLQHGITAEIGTYDVPGISIGEWMLSRAADLGSDLIVMGGYGHTRMRELILGGVTRTILRAMTVPVLFSH